MLAGAAGLATWLQDLLAAGLASTWANDPTAWATAEARLIDAQLPGLAARLHALAPSHQPTGAAGHAARLAGLGELYGLACALGNIEQLSELAQLEVWQQAGLTIRQEALLAAGPPVADEWQVLAEVLEHQPVLTLRRSWLYGRQSGRYALLLQYFKGWEPPLVSVNRTYAGPVVYYPGLLPLRVVAGPLLKVAIAPAAPTAHRIGAMLASYAEALGRLPWLRSWPVALAGVVPACLPDGSWAVHAPAEGQALPLRWPATTAATEAFYDFVVQSNAQPVTVFGEWDGQCLLVHRTWAAAARTATPSPQTPESYLAATCQLLPEAATNELPIAASASAWAEPWPLPLVPGPPPQGTPAQCLLQAAGTAALLRKTGFQPLASGQPLLPFPPEEQLELGPLVEACLRQLLLNESGDFSQLAPPYLEHLRASGRVLPAALLVPLLARNWYHAQLNPANALDYPNSTLLGKRGSWLSQQQENWRVQLAPTPAPTAWEQDAGRQAATYIRQLRTTDPAAARALLAEHLSGLYGHDQAAILAALAVNLTAADEPLLTTFLASPLDSVLEAVVPLLVQLPGSALLERLWARAAPLLALPYSPIGPATLTVQLPAWDPTWRADGLAASAKRTKAAKAAYLLERLLALLPPSRWVAHLGVAAPALLAAAAAHEQASLLLPAWARACVLHHDLPFAKALLLAHATHSGQAGFKYETLDPVFSTEERLALLLQQPAPGTPYAPVLLGGYLLPKLEAPWPAALTDLVMSQLAAGNSLHPAAHPWLTDTLKALPAGAADHQLAAVLAALRELPHPPAPHDYALRQALRGLALRQQMVASLHELASRQAAATP